MISREYKIYMNCEISPIYVLTFEPWFSAMDYFALGEH